MYLKWYRYEILTQLKMRRFDPVIQFRSGPGILDRLIPSVTQTCWETIFGNPQSSSFSGISSQQCGGLMDCLLSEDFIMTVWGPHCLTVDFLLSEDFIMSRLNDFSNQPSFTKHTVMPTSLQTFWGDRLTNLVKTIHLISAEQGWARCNKAEVKCVLTESLLSLRARTRATYQSANIYDAFIFSCNYEHLLWVPIIQALIYAREQSSESSHSLHILSSGGKSGKPSRTAQHSIYFLSITAQDLTDHFKPMNRNSALPDEPRGARGPGEWDSVLSNPSDQAKYM